MKPTDASKRYTKDSFPFKALEILKSLYPDAKSELNFSNDYQLVVSVMLSAQCTDKKVNQVTPSLFKKYPDFSSLAKGKIADIEEIIRPINYYKTKSKNLKAIGMKVHQDFGDKLPINYDDLITLPGVGRKTANVVLSEQGVAHALAVDTHVMRLSNRLKFSKSTTSEKVEEDLVKIFPPEQWRALHHGLILHGRRICKARSPLCAQCELNSICPSAFGC